jgi:prolyl-tRNA synthetase
VKYGHVEAKHCVLVISEFLTRRAYSFYVQEASMNPEAWGLSKFFKKLFNACFPVDFRDKQHEKLESFTQGKHSVQEYVASLKELLAFGASAKR